MISRQCHIHIANVKEFWNIPKATFILILEYLSYLSDLARQNKHIVKYKENTECDKFEECIIQDKSDRLNSRVLSGIQ